MIIREFRLKMGSLLKTGTRPTSTRRQIVRSMFGGHRNDLHDRGFCEQLQLPTPVCGLRPGLFAAAAGFISQEARRTDWPAVA